MDSNATKEADVLVLGDGNFSFSRAYAKRYPHHRVVATSVDTKDALREKYREFDRIVSKLEDLGVQIQYEVDATDVQGTLQETLHTPSSSCGRSFSSATTLTATEATKNPIPSSRRSQPHSASTQLFDLIIFNFPHLGVEDLQAHRHLLSHFLDSARRQLKNKPTARVHVALTLDQANGWELREQAIRAGMHIAGSSAFKPSDWPGYECKRHQVNRSFPLERAFIYALLVASASSPSSSGRPYNAEQRRRGAAATTADIDDNNVNGCKAQVQGEILHKKQQDVVSPPPPPPPPPPSSSSSSSYVAPPSSMVEENNAKKKTNLDAAEKKKLGCPHCTRQFTCKREVANHVLDVHTTRPSFVPQEVELCREIMDIPVAKAAYASPDDHRDAMRRRGSEKKRLLSAIRTRLEIAEGEGRSLHWKDKHLWRFLQEQRYSEKSRYDRRNNDQELKEVGHHEQQRDRKRKREILEETGDTRIREESAAAPVLVAGSQEEKRANDEDEKTTTTTTTQIMASLEEKEEGRPHRTIARKPQTIASMLPSPPKGSGVYKTTNSQPQQQQQQQQSQQERPYCRVCDLAFQSREEWRMHLSMLRPRKIESHVCFVCRRAFRELRALRQHLMHKHPNAARST